MKAYKLTTVILILILTSNLSAADWTRWRGPDHNAISTETDWNPQAVANPQKAWETNVGNGWSAVAVKGDRLYTMGNRDDREIVWCLDVKTGKEIWQFTYDCPAGNFPGPRSTPVLDGGRVYTLSRNGHLHCLDAGSGQLVWMRHLMTEFNVENIQWGFSSSPLIEGNLLLVNATESGMAFNKKTGDMIWTGRPGKAGYATPVIYTMNGKKRAAIFSGTKINGVDLESGDVLWSHTWVTDYDVNAGDPIYADGRLFISSGYGRGCALLDVTGDQVKPVWENESIRNHVSSSLLIDGYVFGPDGNTGKSKSALTCIELATGKVMWSEPVGHNGIMAADGKLIVLTEKGELIIAKATPEKFEALARAFVIASSRNSPCWTMPVLAGGKIYCRNGGGDLVCLDVSK